jgi:hypothetical protein
MVINTNYLLHIEDIMSKRTNYYFCIQGINPAYEAVWLNIYAENEDDAFRQAYIFYRSQCDLSNDDLQGLCMMDKPLTD